MEGKMKGFMREGERERGREGERESRNGYSHYSILNHGNYLR
jgi:hypothetical protein